MAQVLQALNKEWSGLADSPLARRALMRWSTAHPLLAPARTLDDVIAIGRGLDDGPELRRILAGLAPTDDLAARTLLQALLGGLCNMAQRIGRDRDAVDDVVALAWERIRTYPVHRPGSVSGNVLLDVRKGYFQQHAGVGAIRQGVDITAGAEPSPEDRVVGNVVFEELVAAIERGLVSADAVRTIVRSRVVGESMADLAAEQQVSLKVLWHRRWRAEARLRELPLAS